MVYRNQIYKFGKYLSFFDCETCHDNYLQILRSQTMLAMRFPSTNKKPLNVFEARAPLRQYHNFTARTAICGWMTLFPSHKTSVVSSGNCTSILAYTMVPSEAFSSQYEGVSK